MPGFKALPAIGLSGLPPLDSACSGELGSEEDSCSASGTFLLVSLTGFVLSLLATLDKFLDVLASCKDISFGGGDTPIDAGRILLRSKSAMVSETKINWSY